MELDVKWVPCLIALKNEGQPPQRSKTKHLNKCNYNEENTEAINHRLLTINQDGIKNCDDPNVTFQQFFDIFNTIFESLMLRAPG